MSRIPDEYVAFANRLSTYLQSYVRKVRAEVDDLIDSGPGAGPRTLASGDAAGAARIRGTEPPEHRGVPLRVVDPDRERDGPASTSGPEGQRTSARPDRRRVVAIVRSAGSHGGNFGIGRAGRPEADAAGLAWVGAEPRRLPYGDAYRWVSADGLRQYRPPQQKPSGRGVEANYESRSAAARHWESNAHLEIER
ncbi:hypothetical protein [Nocardia jinanensis]|uniref:hypothetical protein n=1 Tax=Nocardia jinanensis TaxID=382504 RepID=UPI000AB70547|nr:hypothetical protein [Nocardia jinanensis]